MIDSNYVIEMQRKVHQDKPRIITFRKGYNANVPMILYPYFLKFKVIIHHYNIRNERDILNIQNVEEIIIHFPIF